MVIDRETDADKSGDCHTLKRKLDRILYLVVKKQGEQNSWQMPQGNLHEGKTLSQVHVTSQYIIFHSL